MTLDSLLKNHKIFLDYPVDLKKVLFLVFFLQESSKRENSSVLFVLYKPVSVCSL